ncbi:MAG: ATP-binding protein [Oscillospiraceae bacterium]
MKYTDIVTNKKAAAKAAWLIYVLCSAIILVMAHFSGWEIWVSAMLLFNIAFMTLMTFHPKISVKFQSVFLMLLSFENIFVCSLMEGTIYQSIPVFLGAAILIAVYKNERLLFWYNLLIAGGILFHIFILNSIPFGTSLEVTEFIVRISVMFTAQFFLMAFIKAMDKNEEEMLKSVEEARQAERYKSDFLANMSHEIRTPMNAIVGMCELILRESGLSESARENCFNIQTSGRSLLAIINDILDFSKIESGKMELINDEFNIASTINDVINMSEARKGNKKIEILVNADPDIPRGLVGDEVRIRQIIINLMTNAVKFTEKGSVTLTVSKSKQEYGINIFVSVADTGIGITEENIEKLFTSFRQVDTKKNRSVEGTGLGLAISKRLITQMGGFISVKSEYGSGTEFRFVIPLKVSDERPFITVKEPVNIHAAGCFGRSDSAVGYRQLFLDMGSRLKVDVRCADSAEELKKLAESEKFTHIFVSREEYIGGEEFFRGISDKSQVFVVQDRVDAVNLPDKIRCVYKPLYGIPMASALNNENMVLNLNERRGAAIRFTAPKARILIVDDNAINLKVAAGLMRPYNMQIMTAESGPAAIRMLRSKDVDLVFMDHMMPEMDGVEATEIIRGMEGDYYKKLPVIALTANAVNGAREMFINSGFNDFIAKPIELSALDRVLRNYLPKEYMQAPSNSNYGKTDRRKAVKQNYESSPMFDPDKGLSYTGGDDSAYREILALYIKKGEEKRKYIDELFEKKDWKNYIIEVHALKSTSLSIGAIKLSELAKELEAAGKSERYDAVEKKNGELSRLYGEIIDIASEYLGGFDDEEEAPEQVENTELPEISCEALDEYIRKAKDACCGFDGDTMAAVAEEAAAYSYRGEPLKKYFGKAAELAEDFEYDAAAAEIAKLEAAKEGE